MASLCAVREILSRFGAPYNDGCTTDYGKNTPRASPPSLIHNNAYAKITEHNNGFSKFACVNGIRPYDGGDDGRISFAPTMGGMTGGMVLKILPPVVQNGLKIPHS
ncbi:MAG: hypothetical protein RL076_645 [Chloroflexota bacterium]